jgi:hypothetical protein
MTYYKEGESGKEREANQMKIMVNQILKQKYLL